MLIKNIFKCLFIVCFGTSSLISQTYLKTIDKLPDTGQDKDFTSIFGEDSDYSINPLSYTKNNDGTVTDNVTGLMWQQLDGGEMTIENARIYADTLTFAGFSDWRLPTPFEAYTIMNQNYNNPAIDRDHFSSNNAQYWWTSTAQHNDANKIWVINAGGGIGNHLKSETISAGGDKKYHVRVLRDRNLPVVLTKRYSSFGNSIIDHFTGLMWYKSPFASKVTWESALQNAEDFSKEGYSDWRLPNIKEIQSLTDYSRSNPSCDLIFTELDVDKYWSSTSLSNQPTQAWYWDNRFGITTYADKNQLLKQIFVRSYSIPNAIQDASLEAVHITNPFYNKIHIINHSEENFQYKLFAQHGNLIYNGDAIGDQDFSHLTSGMYYLILKHNDALRLIKMVKF